ncbi:NADPH:adrenodoxin oxidoreductase-like protein [Calycina marina]|uniref:NADPH:adrenodoxin oxidoreductase, mitochondrial n=1 Tax=Calycina marina TaxID=1763456 RepID=A0A9P8CJT3_9HELO|nr:NADPH:adrenodoxin oxidoreductase-like protein [Calycina marina]
MAVIGSGPAGFYTAYKVMSRLENAKVDMFEQLPVPYGLVRYGVAPDHPEVKNCQDKFEEVAGSPNFSFMGNVTVGDFPGQLPLRTMAPHYDAICFAYGASKDRLLDIPGEKSLSGIYSARAFVGWYNGLPEYADLNPDLTQGEEATIIGQGNVALDVARILLQDTGALKSTDIAEHAIETLQNSKVKRIRIVGRRGPLQAAYTIKEIRELVKLPNVAFHPVDESLIPKDIEALSRPQKRLMELLKKGSKTKVESAEKSWSLDFCLAPRAFIASKPSDTQLGSITFEKMTLSPDPFDPNAKANSAHKRIQIPSTLCFRSIGYRSEPLHSLPGSSEFLLPFHDCFGIIPNDGEGRVRQPVTRIQTPKAFEANKQWYTDTAASQWTPIDNDAMHRSQSLSGEEHSINLPFLYCAGWVKRGPTGVIASTMADAFATADTIVHDWTCQGRLYSFPHPIGGLPEKSTGLGWEGVKRAPEYKYLRRVSWEDWKRLDAEEKRRGQLKGKEREKFTSIKKMLDFIDTTRL